MIVYLYPKAPFANSIPRSDTLFGALAWAIRLLYGRDELEGLLRDFDTAIADDILPPFLLSSLFPFFEDAKGKILFFPNPILPPPQLSISSESEYRRMKELKRVSLLSQSVFEGLISGRISYQTLFTRLDKDYALTAGALMTKDEYERVKVMDRLSVNSEAARNTINRLTNSTDSEQGGQLFYQKVVAVRSIPKFRVRSGLFMLLKTERQEMLKAALRYISDKGIGGDTTIGRGHCEAEFDNSSLNEYSGRERCVTLSIFHPSAHDTQHLREHSDKIFGQLERRKGFLEASYLHGGVQVWKPTLLSFKEGTTFPDYGRQVYGTLYREQRIRLNMDYNIRINGLAYTVAMKEVV